MVASVAVVAEQELIVVLGLAADGAAFAFDALPGVLFHGDDHIRGELEASRMTRTATFGAANEILGLIRLLVLARAAEAEIAVAERRRPVFARHGFRNLGVDGDGGRFHGVGAASSALGSTA